MAKEQLTSFEKFLAREISLPFGLKKYIRDLKQAGEFDLAMREASKLRKEKLKNQFKKGTVDQELVLVIERVLNSDEPEVTDKFKALWLLHRKGVLSVDAVGLQIRDMLHSLPAYQQEVLAEKSVDLRHEVEALPIEN